MQHDQHMADWRYHNARRWAAWMLGIPLSELHD